jgi:putative oxidoreductase
MIKTIIFGDLPLLRAIGLLVLRVGCGLSMATHGLAKYQGFAGMVDKFDPIGLGGPVSLSLVVFAELFCALAVAAGLLTRLACVPLIITMLVAALVAHAEDPFAKKEMAVIYLSVFATLALAGAGPFSLDAVIAQRLDRKKA